MNTTREAGWMSFYCALLNKPLMTRLITALVRERSKGRYGKRRSEVEREIGESLSNVVE